MKGWKSVERIVSPGVSYDEARRVLLQEGCTVHIENDKHIILKRSGTIFALTGGKFPIEITIAGRGEGIFLQLRYDGFVLFDTGDLSRIADAIEDKLRQE